MSVNRIRSYMFCIGRDHVFGNTFIPFLFWKKQSYDQLFFLIVGPDAAAHALA